MFARSQRIHGMERIAVRRSVVSSILIDVRTTLGALSSAPILLVRASYSLPYLSHSSSVLLFPLFLSACTASILG